MYVPWVNTPISHIRTYKQSCVFQAEYEILMLRFMQGVARLYYAYTYVYAQTSSAPARNVLYLPNCGLSISNYHPVPSGRLARGKRRGREEEEEECA